MPVMLICTIMSTGELLSNMHKFWVGWPLVGNFFLCHWNCMIGCWGLNLLVVFGGKLMYLHIISLTAKMAK